MTDSAIETNKTGGDSDPFLVCRKSSDFRELIDHISYCKEKDRSQLYLSGAMGKKPQLSIPPCPGFCYLAAIAIAQDVLFGQERNSGHRLKPPLGSEGRSILAGRRTERRDNGPGTQREKRFVAHLRAACPTGSKVSSPLHVWVNASPSRRATTERGTSSSTGAISAYTATVAHTLRPKPP